MIDNPFRSRLPTDVQNEAIPAILGGGDVLMVSDVLSAFEKQRVAFLCFRRPRLEAERPAHFVYQYCKSCGKPSKMCKAVGRLEVKDKSRI